MSRPGYEALTKARYAADTAALRWADNDPAAALAEIRSARAYLDNAEACIEALAPAVADEAIPTATLVARKGGKTQALIDSLLSQAEGRGLTVEVVYLEDAAS